MVKKNKKRSGTRLGTLPPSAEQRQGSQRLSQTERYTPVWMLNSVNTLTGEWETASSPRSDPKKPRGEFVLSFSLFYDSMVPCEGKRGKKREKRRSAEAAQQCNCSQTNPCISLIYYELPSYAAMWNTKLAGGEPRSGRSYPADTRGTDANLRTG